ncbi:MAG: hypothetical protein NDI75_08660, partial [Candidatus Didemnitutus sp.]|nr:hypothetical protein [Candidatus Didemnitutus sp.]
MNRPTPFLLRRLSLVLFLLTATGAALAADPAPRERQAFNDGWKFHLGEDPTAGEALQYERVKAVMLATGDHLLNYRPPQPTPPPPA